MPTTAFSLAEDASLQEMRRFCQPSALADDTGLLEWLTQTANEASDASLPSHFGAQSLQAGSYLGGQSQVSQTDIDEVLNTPPLAPRLDGLSFFDPRLLAELSMLPSLPATLKVAST